MSGQNATLEENSVWFETQMTQFEGSNTIADGQKRSNYERRSGLKKVDDEHLLKLAKKTESEARKQKELQ